jgi:bacterial leucyl aminopeptidase
MDRNDSPVIFFDVNGTLGSVTESYANGAGRGLVVYPDVPDQLQALRDNGARIGIVSTAPQDQQRQSLATSGLDGYVETDLIIAPASGDTTSSFTDLVARAAREAGRAAWPERCLFVSVDSRSRRDALEAGLRAAPDPALAWDVLNGARLRYIRVSVPADRRSKNWRGALAALPVVPLYQAPDGDALYLIATTAAAARLDDLGFSVDRLGYEDEPLTTDLYLLRDDRQVQSGFLAARGHSSQYFAEGTASRWVLSSTRDGLFISLPAGRSLANYHFEDTRHGHTMLLLPDRSLLRPFGSRPEDRLAGWLTSSAAEPTLRDEVAASLDSIDPALIGGNLDPISGVKPLDDEDPGKVRSRDILSSDNSRVTRALVRALSRIGDGAFSVSIHEFVHKGRRLVNVVAELPGTGSDEIVLITAHLDSTGALSDTPNDPATGRAPGADDDGSGVAGVLGIAAVFESMARQTGPKRTLRFVLFNAEEYGLIGSKVYAKDQARLAAPIVAVYQMDMIGYHKNPPRSFEVHVGIDTSPDVQERSLVLARRIHRLTGQISPGLEAPQIYTSPDPAAGRSDHASFQERGYAACVVSEDFFAGPAADSPQPEANPNYHKDTDTFVDLSYAADIARVVAAAAWATADA